MGILKSWIGKLVGEPRADASIGNMNDVLEALRSALAGGTGNVSPNKAMQVAAVYACVRLISGAVATLPLHIKERKGDNVREDASDSSLWKVLRRKPNRWQTPSQFRRMMEAHLLLRGNAYARIVRSMDRVVELIPLHPDRMTVKQLPTGELAYVYQRKEGGNVPLRQVDVMHLVGMTLDDGFTGVSPITYARHTIGLSLSMEEHGRDTFKNGARFSSVLKHPHQVGPEAQATLKAGLDAYRKGGENEGKTLVLEEGMDIASVSMTAEDVQWIEGRKFSRTDIAMFFGVPPHMIGDTEKSTSWGSGIEQQSIGFVAYTLENSLTTWEESINRDLIEDGSNQYARFNRAALVKGDIKTRWGSYKDGLMWGVYSPNEIRALEDMNPREGGDIYYPPPNTAGNSEKSGETNEPA
ncbi:phage portal protein [Maritalea sp.]|uniref:phage portal protein n=1 Tax=Maritalea sp. TaxID=2003361 RepID=UPI003EF30394